MDSLIDSGFLYAIYDADDKHHKRVINALGALPDETIMFLPTIVLVEVCYLLSKISHYHMKTFINDLKGNELFNFVHIQESDLGRIFELLKIYSDNELDFVDASITALAERLKIYRILTVDQRDFRIIRPTHCDYFDILP